MKVAVAVIALFFSISAVGQKPVAEALPGILPQGATPSATSILTPKDTKAALKIQLAVERQTTVGLQAQMVQKAIESQMRELQGKYSEQDALITEGIEEVRKENDWGKDVNLDRNPQSPTYGKWIKNPSPAATETSKAESLKPEAPKASDPAKK